MFSHRFFPGAACVLVTALAAFSVAGVQAAALAKPGAAGATRVALAPIEQAHTFAQRRQGDQGDQVSTLLVLALGQDSVSAIDLSELSGLHSRDAFDVIGRFDGAALDGLARQTQRARSYRLVDLLGVGPRGLAHIAAGTNYPAHGKEVGMHEAFLFPKISPAGGPRVSVATGAEVLLDYEVEVCARFDREVRSLADFDQARAGFFLCGDFSDRATLVRKLNLKNIASGDGFPDAKSGPDRFPAGPFLVVPHDWKTFLKDVQIETLVNGERRQLAQAGDMIKDLRAIVGESLAEASSRTWAYQGTRIPMLSRGAIGTGTAILTGTGEGVVFKEPGPAVIKDLMRARDRSQQMAVIDRYLAGESAKGIYLQPGNLVRHASNYLGWIDATVVAPATSGN